MRDRKTPTVHSGISRDLPNHRPYADADIVSLIIGRDATPFSVHSTFLAQSAVLASKIQSGSVARQHVSIPELDKPTAHTLVHYLYTGNYEELRTSSSSGASAASTYAASTCVYCAAVRYELPGLAELAKAKIKSFDQQVSISDVLCMARDHAFPLLPEGEIWYPAYLETTIQSAMAKDPEPFKRPEFITQVEGNSRLLQIVWKTVMSNYTSLSVASHAADTEFPAELNHAGDEKIFEVRDDERMEHVGKLDDLRPASADGSQTTAVANDTSNGISSPGVLSEANQLDDASIVSSLKLETESTVSSHKTPDAFTDELGYGKSKVYQTMGSKGTDLEALVKQGSKADSPAKLRADSVTELVAPAKDIEHVAKDAVEVEVSDKLEASPTVETAISAKKNKKKDKKKKPSTVF